MQYLSKAYNYYSGINPATLSGAIDVIVVRHVDDDGEVTLSSSPFHVRFGKLQVLRAGEKRVTMRMPNNLPPPHIAPFSMKVGESGEAFFVLETDEDVPEELLTSPVVMPTEPALPPTPPLSTSDSGPPSHPTGDHNGGDSTSSTHQQQETHASLTQQPFGETEQQVHHESHENDPGYQADLSDVEPLDLDQPAEQPPAEAAGVAPPKHDLQHLADLREGTSSPSSILNAATNLLPSVPFLSSNPSSRSSSKSEIPSRAEEILRSDPEKLLGPDNEASSSSLPPIEKLAKQNGAPLVSKTDGTENPAQTRPGESPDIIERDEKLSHYKHEQHAEGKASGDLDNAIPKVLPGEGEGPDVMYGKDVVLDMSGYHSSTEAKDDGDRTPRSNGRSQTPQPGSTTSAIESVESSNKGSEIEAMQRKALLVQSFAHDLLASIPPHSRPSQAKAGPSKSRTPIPDSLTKPSLREHISASEIQGAMDMDMEESRSTPTQDLPKSLASLSLETHEDSPSKRNASPRRFDRGASEPPPDLEEEEIPPTLGETSTSSHGGRRPQGSPLARPPNGSIYPYATHAPTERPTTPVNYNETWDWTRMPSSPPESGGVDDLKRSLEMERSTSGPPIQSTHKSDSEAVPPASLDLATPSKRPTQSDPNSSTPGRLKNVEENPYLFVLEMTGGKSYTFELALCGSQGFPSGSASTEEESTFIKNRITFQKFIEDPQVVDDPSLVIRYSLIYLTWSTGNELLYALSLYRRSLTPPGYSTNGAAPLLNGAGSQGRKSGTGWSRWWRRGQTTTPPPTSPSSVMEKPNGGIPIRQTESDNTVPTVAKVSPPTPEPSITPPKHYAKTLRLSSDQLKSLNLKSGPNTVSFSVTSSYSGMATCTARIFLWDSFDQIVISDIDGTITKSDALGHLYAAIGRDWTHVGIAKLYTDIANNGYKLLYLTSRAIGQADSTREYLKSIQQMDYRLPEGPVIMSPDRLMASLHREVIMRKPELFKMACLRDIQRLFGSKAKESFFAGFGNRITDAMSYRSVGIDTSKIYTIDSTGVVKTELLQAAGHKGSYVGLNDLVNETFPPVKTKFKPEYTDFNWWRDSIPDVPLPDLTPVPVSPALSARSASSAGSSRYNVLGRISQTIGRRPSKQPLLPTNVDDAKHSASSRPSSPLIAPSLTQDELSDEDYEGENEGRRSRQSSMPGSFESDTKGDHFPEFMRYRSDSLEGEAEEGRRHGFELEDWEDRRTSKSSRRKRAEGNDEGDEGVEGDESTLGGDGDSFDDGAIFDDDILATGEMKNVPF